MSNHHWAAGHSAEAIALESGYTSWIVLIEPPEREHLEGSLPLCATKRAQWTLGYAHGQFPSWVIAEGMTISYRGRSYLLLSSGSNTLRVQTMSTQAFFDEAAPFVGETGAFQLTPMREERLQQRRNARHRSARRGHATRIVEHPRFVSSDVRVWYEVEGRALPHTLRADLPWWQEDVLLTGLCCLQLYVQHPGEALVSWQPDGGDAPTACTIVREPRAGSQAPVLRLSEEEASMLAAHVQQRYFPKQDGQAETSTHPKPTLRPRYVAPATILPDALRAMIAPGVSFDVTDQEAHAIAEEIYYRLTGLTYEDREQGTLELAYVTSLVDRLCGRQTGLVHTVWLRREHITQSLEWTPQMRHLDSYGLRSLVQAYATQQGAEPVALPSRDDVAAHTRARREAMEEHYNRVPAKSPWSATPLELFVSTHDLDPQTVRRHSPVGAILAVLDRYSIHPERLPDAEQLPVSVLRDLAAMLREDLRQVEVLNRRWNDLFPGEAHPDTTRFVLERVVTVQTKRVVDARTRKRVSVQVHTLVGYRVRIGVLPTAVIREGAVLSPRAGKPVIEPPEPITKRRTPNYIIAPSQRGAA